MNNKTYIYSGQCRLCEVGRETAILDHKEEKLYTGDIVIIWTEANCYIPKNLTVVVSHDYENIHGCEPKFIKKDMPFVMGIKNAKVGPGEWWIAKVKSYKDVIDGEHWKEFGFSYKSFME
jgi:hypothetical protein